MVPAQLRGFSKDVASVYAVRMMYQYGAPQAHLAQTFPRDAVLEDGRELSCGEAPCFWLADAWAGQSHRLCRHQARQVCEGARVALNWYQLTTACNPLHLYEAVPSSVEDSVGPLLARRLSGVQSCD
jgi:hypothetical protein